MTTSAHRRAKADKTGAGTGLAGIRDIATRAGASIATVSRVVNGSGYVSPATRARIESVIAEVQFRPNAGAASMRRGKSRMVGVLLPALDVKFFGILGHVIEQALFARGYHAFICCSSESPEREAEYVAAMLAQRVDGVIIASVTSDTVAAARLTAAGVPIVAVDRAIAGAVTVTADHTAGGRLMAEHLLGLGHRRIAVVGAPEHSTPVTQRLAGVTDALAAAGLAPVAVRLGAGHNFEDCRALAASFLAEGIGADAVIGLTDLAAIGAIHALHERGIAVPQDVSVIGFDDMPMARYVIPQLTTVAQPIREIGALAVEQIVRMMTGVDIATEGLPALSVVVRGTTAQRPA